MSVKISVVHAAVAAALLAGVNSADAQTCNGAMRKLNIGVAVSPPNVVHTAPFVAKGMGYFAKRCIEPNIIQFDGGQAGTAITAVSQGTVTGPLSELAISRGLKGKQIWEMAPKLPQAYVTQASIKTLADLKGKRLSAAGGPGGFNWMMGRELLRRGGIGVDDAVFISQGTAGRLPGLLVGQVDAVFLHPEDVFMAHQKKPALHVLTYLSDVMPDYAFNAYGASDDMIAKNHDLLRDAMAAMIEANRAVYREPDKVLPIIMDATKKPKDAVQYAIGVLTKNCVLSVNEGFDERRTEWTMQHFVDVGAAKTKLTFDQLVDIKLAKEAVAAAGGRATINNCSL